MLGENVNGPWKEKKGLWTELAHSSRCFLVFFLKQIIHPWLTEFSPSPSLPHPRPIFLSSSASFMPPMLLPSSLSLLFYSGPRELQGTPRSPTLIRLMVPRFCPRSQHLDPRRVTQLLRPSVLPPTKSQQGNITSEGCLQHERRQDPHEVLSAPVTCPACFLEARRMGD